MKSKESRWIKCVDCGLQATYVVKCRDGKSRCCKCTDEYEQQKLKGRKNEQK